MRLVPPIRSLAVLLVCVLVGACRPAAEQTHEPTHAHASEGAEGHRVHTKHHRFDDAEKWAAVFDDPARDEWQKPDEVVAWMQLRSDMSVADVGAGTGYFAVRFARVLPDGEVVANDVEPDMVRHLRERAGKEGLTNLVAVQGTATDPAIGRKVDVVFMCDVYHHIEDLEAFFTAVAGALEEGGRVVIVDFRKDAPEDAPGPPPAMRVAADRIVEQLAPLGFSELRRDAETLPYQYVLELALER